MELAEIRVFGTQLADTARAVPNEKHAAELRRLAADLHEWTIRAEHGDQDAYCRNIALAVLKAVGPDANDDALIRAGRAALDKLENDGWFTCEHVRIIGYSADDIADGIWFRYADPGVDVSWVRYGRDFFSTANPSNPVTARDVDRMYPLPGAGFIQVVAPIELAGTPA